ncbi:hypothetical protein GYA19_01140 [Candidatus Beckwithbacteria bacterium]|nr:hypothetical protein [Candidatus Beckwithbacteria bacterium]
MENLKRRINFWYFVILLSVITITTWFFVEMNKISITNDKTYQNGTNHNTKIDQNFNENSINNLKKRVIIDKDILNKVPKYTNEKTSRQNEVKTVNLNNSNIATLSGNIEENQESSPSAYDR